MNEIIDRSDWVRGNAAAFIIDGTGLRTAEAFDGSAAPTLFVEFSDEPHDPTTSGIEEVNVAENAVSTEIDLFAAFDDVDSADADLSYTIVLNTNPALFAATPINGTLGTLTLDYAADIVGSADIVVRATDPGGLFVETTFTVTVSEVNDAPVRTAGTVANLQVTEDSGITSFGLSGLSYGPGGGADEAGQTLTYTITAVPSTSLGEILRANNTTIVTPGNYTLAQIQGMRFRPAPNASGGPATFSFSVTDNGTTGGVADPLSLPESLTITVSEVNDAPVRTAGTVADLQVAEDSGISGLGLAGLAYSPGGGVDEAGQTLSYSVTAVPPASLGEILLAESSTVVAPGPYSLAQIQGMQFRPALNANGGPATFSFSVTDDGTTSGSVATKSIVETLDISTVLAATEELNVRISTSFDDTEETSSGGIRRGSNDLGLTTDDGDTQKVGLRFQNLAIPAGAIVTKAYVQFQSEEVGDQPTSLLIWGHASDNADTFGRNERNVSSRPATSATVSWSPLPWNSVGEAGDRQRTPDLASIVQEIIDRPGWIAGNALALLISGNGERVAESYDGLPNAAPLLHVEFSTGSVANRAPVLDPMGNHAGPQGGVLSFTASANDSDSPAQHLTFSIDGGAPTGATIDPATGHFQWALSESVTLGTHEITIRVTDDGSPSRDDFETILVDVTSAAGATTIESQIVSTLDDAEEFNGSVRHNSTVLDLVDLGDVHQVVGLRFLDIDIPAGATVISATIQFESFGANSQSTQLTLRGNDSSDAAEIAKTRNDLSSRTKTTASVQWAPEAWSTAGEAGPRQRTPDLSSIIQEIVDRPDWSSGNAVAILIEGAGRRRAKPFNLEPSAAPRLSIEFVVDESVQASPAPPSAMLAALPVTQSGAVALDGIVATSSLAPIDDSSATRTDQEIDSGESAHAAEELSVFEGDPFRDESYWREAIDTMRRETLGIELEGLTDKVDTLDDRWFEDAADSLFKVAGKK